jgi:hypothetical protein
MSPLADCISIESVIDSIHIWTELGKNPCQTYNPSYLRPADGAY